MTHTSTEQPAALQGAQAIIRRQHARILELEAEKARLLETYVPKPKLTENYAKAAQAVQMTLEQAQQGAQPVAWLAEYVDREGNLKWYVSTHKDLATENDIHGTPKPLYTHPAMQV